jgi:hypothetical protein
MWSKATQESYKWRGIPTSRVHDSPPRSLSPSQVRQQLHLLEGFIDKRQAPSTKNATFHVSLFEKDPKRIADPVPTIKPVL